MTAFICRHSLPSYSSRSDTASRQKGDNLEREETALGELFETRQGEPSYSTSRMFSLLNDPEVFEVTVNRFDRIFYSDPSGRHAMHDVFPGPKQYADWLASLLEYTDISAEVLTSPRSGPVEAAFLAEKTSIRGSIHIIPSSITYSDPAVTIRLDAYRPDRDMTLDTLLGQGVMSEPMRDMLEQAVRGRSNILVSGGSGAGKTTLMRALAWYVDPAHRVVTVEEIKELHLEHKLPNVVSMVSLRVRDEDGRILREETLYDLVREAFRMRPDRIWVGEVRGREAYALVRACNSGHDGACATLHADSPQQALRQLVTYVMEAGVPEEVSREQVSRAVNIVLQVSRVEGKRVVTDMSELEPVREGSNQRENLLFQYDAELGRHLRRGHPSPALLRRWSRYGVSYSQGNFG